MTYTHVEAKRLPSVTSLVPNIIFQGATHYKDTYNVVF